MTNAEVINTLNEMWERLFTEMRGWIFEDLKKEGKLDEFKEAFDIAIKALKRESVLNKIKAEIEALPKTYPFANHIDMYVKEDDVRKIIDKHKAESEGKK